MDLFKFKKKPVIIALHGFGKRKSKEFDNLKTALNKEKYQLITVDLFDENDPTDIEWTSWVAKANKIVRENSFQDEIILIGFSMGGVIASYLASQCNVKKLILLAPAFEYFNIANIFDYVIKPFDKNYTPSLPQQFTSTFVDVIKNCKDSIKDINVPTIIMHCENDQVIPVSSSHKIINKIPHDKKILITFSKGQHKILDDEIIKDIAINTIIDFIKNKILI